MNQLLLMFLAAFAVSVICTPLDSQPEMLTPGRSSEPWIPAASIARSVRKPRIGTPSFPEGSVCSAALRHTDKRPPGSDS